MSSNNIPMVNHPYKTAQGQKRYVRDILLQVQKEETLKKNSVAGAERRNFEKNDRYNLKNRLCCYL